MNLDGQKVRDNVCSFVQNHSHQILTGALDLALVVSDIIIRGYYVCMNENMYLIIYPLLAIPKKSHYLYLSKNVKTLLLA